ncbi:MAG: class I SAM-dependent methyltransferase [Dissulfurimicrobium sp.]|uniref:class I SAM-dependent methyltransferase n=1 Tax=Dissulfurimicrobium sp. TaxID=2022436 RepID=UPI00404A1364
MSIQKTNRTIGRHGLKKTSNVELDIKAIKKAYRRYAQVYDFYFGAIFNPGRRSVIERMNLAMGERILEVGVGTGLSLPIYPSYVKITGIDISPEMLEQARKRKEKYNLDHVEKLDIMDAEAMDFPDNSFDKVVAMYVASVVPNPMSLINEMKRVCKSEGEIFIVNHFRHNNPLIGKIECMVAPLSKYLGFRPNFCLEEFIEDTGLELIEKSPVNMFGYWTLLRARNNKTVQTTLKKDVKVTSGLRA